MKLTKLNDVINCKLISVSLNSAHFIEFQPLLIMIKCLVFGLLSLQKKKKKKKKKDKKKKDRCYEMKSVII